MITRESKLRACQSRKPLIIIIILVASNTPLVILLNHLSSTSSLLYQPLFYRGRKQMQFHQPSMVYRLISSWLRLSPHSYNKNLTCKSFSNNFPVNNLPKVFDILWPCILFIKIICMLPYITGHDWRLSITQWIYSI